MELRDTVNKLHRSFTPEQRKRFETEMPEEVVECFDAIFDDGTSDEDFKMAVVAFALSLDDPDQLKGILTEDQNALVDQLELILKAEMGF